MRNFSSFFFIDTVTELYLKQCHCANNEVEIAEESLGERILEKRFLVIAIIHSFVCLFIKVTTMSQLLCEVPEDMQVNKVTYPACPQVDNLVGIFQLQ